MRLLWNIEHNLQSASKLMAARLGITGPQRLVLRVVAQSPGISAKDVARLLHLHPSTVTGILQRLEKKKVLLRGTDPNDTRRVRLRALPSAHRYTRRAPGTVEYAVEQTLRRLTPASVRSARRVLSDVAAALDANGANGA